MKHPRSFFLNVPYDFDGWLKVSLVERKWGGGVLLRVQSLHTEVRDQFYVCWLCIVLYDVLCDGNVVGVSGGVDGVCVG